MRTLPPGLTPRRTIGLGAALVVAVWLVLLSVSAVIVRQEARAGRVALEQAQQRLRASDVDGVTAALRDARNRLNRTARHVGSVWVAPLQVLPVVGDDVRYGRALVAAVAEVGRAGGAVADAVDVATATLAESEGGLPLGAVQRLAPAVTRLDRGLARVEEVVADGARLRLVDPVDAQRGDLQEQLTGILAQAHDAADLLAVLPDLLGADEPQTYLLFASNPAEQRGTGGYLGSYARMVVDRGRLQIGDFDRLQDLGRLGPDAVEPPNADYQPRYRHLGGTGAWQNLNLTPDFPSVGLLVERLWHKQFGERIDGVIAVDPFAYRALLEIGGPVRLPGLQAVTAQTVVDYVTNGAFFDYEGYEAERRQEELGAVASAALEGFLAAPVTDDLGRTVRTLTDALASGHLLVHVADPQVQAVLASLGVDGALRVDGPDGTGGDYLGVVYNNGGSNKLDYYQHRDLRYVVRPRADLGVDVDLDVTIRNGAPSEGPQYVLGPGPAYLESGDSYGLLSVYCGRQCDVLEGPASLLLTAPEGERVVERVTSLEDRRSVELGSQILDTWVFLRPGATETYDFALQKPDVLTRRADGRLRYRLVLDNQVTVRATTLEVALEVPAGFVVAEAPPDATVEAGRVSWRWIGRRDRVFDVVLAPEGADAG